MTPLDLDLVEAELHRHAIPWNLHHLVACPSTQDAARDALNHHAERGWLLATDFQAAGRGRQGRTWTTPPGRAVLFSTILEPVAARPNLTPLLAGLAVADGVESCTGVAPELKWPNDLLVGGRKLAGILTERPPGQLVIVGAGVNVNQSPGELPDGAGATSLAVLLGHELDREAVLASVLNAFDACWARAGEGDQAWLLSAWRRRSRMLGQPVRFTFDGAVREGLAEDIDANGALLVRRPDGTLTALVAGEVQEVRTAGGQL